MLIWIGILKICIFVVDTKTKIMRAKIQKWGNSQGLRIAKNLLTDAQLDVGDQVDISGQ